MLIMWIGIFVICLILELVSVGLTSIWFAIGAVFGGIAQIAGAHLWLQIVLFLMSSVALLIITKPLADKYLNSKRVMTNYESYIGQIVRITEKVDNIGQTGKTTLNGQEWTVRSSDANKTIDVGMLARVHSVEGVKLIVEEYDGAEI